MLTTTTPAIQAPAHPPSLHPHDRPLLRPIAALGKPKVAEATVSFLRRTEYISSLAPKRHDGAAPRALLAKANRGRRVEASADSPQVIKRKIDKSFDVAEQNLKDPKRVKHPTKKHLKLVDASPLIPDLDAFPDSGAYVTIKFLTNPVPASTEYDKRLLSGLFKPIDRTQAEDMAYEAALEAHEQDPQGNPKPQNLMNYDFYLSQSADTGDRFRRKFDVEGDDHHHEDGGGDDLYTHQNESGGCFQFNRLRAYETAGELELDHPTKYDEEIILAYNEDTFYPNQKAVYYYPVMQKSTIRPQRTKNIARTIGIADDQEQTIDQLDVVVQDPSEEMRDAMKRYRQYPLGWDAEEEEEEDEQQAHVKRGSSPARRTRSPSEDRDAEGEDEE